LMRIRNETPPSLKCTLLAYKMQHYFTKIFYILWFLFRKRVEKRREV
jgi:hypothetical protein